MGEYLKQALNDYNELCVLAHKYSYKTLVDKVNGYNNDGDRFDVNFKSIRATVWNRKAPYVESHIDIWDDKNSCCIEEEIDITALIND